MAAQLVGRRTALCDATSQDTMPLFFFVWRCRDGGGRHTLTKTPSALRCFLYANLCLSARLGNRRLRLPRASGLLGFWASSQPPVRPLPKSHDASTPLLLGAGLPCCTTDTNRVGRARSANSPPNAAIIGCVSPSLVQHPSRAQFYNTSGHLARNQRRTTKNARTEAEAGRGARVESDA